MVEVSIKNHLVGFPLALDVAQEFLKKGLPPCWSTPRIPLDANWPVSSKKGREKGEKEETSSSFFFWVNWFNSRFVPKIVFTPLGNARITRLPRGTCLMFGDGNLVEADLSFISMVNEQNKEFIRFKGLLDESSIPQAVFAPLGFGYDPWFQKQAFKLVYFLLIFFFFPVRGTEVEAGLLQKKKKNEGRGIQRTQS